MIEIDGVRRALENIRPLEYGDSLSDTYLRVIELVTRTSLNSSREQELLTERRVLEEDDEPIRRALRRYGEYDGESVSMAYDNALGQIDVMLPVRLRRELSELRRIYGKNS